MMQDGMMGGGYLVQHPLDRSTLSPGSHPMGGAMDPRMAAMDGGQLPPVGTTYGPGPPGMPQQQMLEEDAGPAERKCTNGGWLVSLLVTVAVAIFVAVQGLARGRPADLVKGSDFQGFVCGVDESVKKLPFLYYPMDPKSGSLLLRDGRCVGSCPSEEDAKKKIMIPLTQRVTRARSELGAIMVLDLEVATAAYATELIANEFCMPSDPKLRNQVIHHLSGPRFRIPAALGSLYAGWPVIFNYSSIALLVALISTWSVRQLPVITVHASAYGSALALIFGGLCCLSWGVGGRAALENSATAADAARIFGGRFWYLLLGLVMISCGILIVGLFLKSTKNKERSIRVLDMCGDVFSDMPNLVVGPLLSSLASLTFMWFWLLVFIYISSVSEIRPRYDDELVERNGPIAPLHKAAYFPAGSALVMIFWILFGAWALQIVKAITQFVSCYAGTIWYFASPEGADDKEMGWCPVLVALSLGIANHLGSFAYGGLMMGVTAPIRMLGGWASYKNEFSTDPSVSIMNTLCAPLKNAFRQAVDFFTAGGFVEMAISSADFWTAMQVSSRRLGLPASPAAKLSGVLNSPVNHYAAAISVPLALMSYMSVTSNVKYNAHDSPSFVAFPLVVAVATFAFCWTSASLFGCMWSSLGDSLFYSYLVESSSPNGEVDENPVEKLHAHSFLRDLIIEAMDEEIAAGYY